MSGFNAHNIKEHFRYHPPSPEQTEKYDKINDAYETLAEIVLEITPPSAEQTLAIRGLISSKQLANESIAIHGK